MNYTLGEFKQISIILFLILFLVVGCGGGNNGHGTAGSPPGVTVSSVTPSSVTAGSPETSLTVHGGGFGATSTVFLNGHPLTTAFVSANQLTATVPSTSEIVAIVYELSVGNPPSGEGQSTAIPFTIGNPQPALNSLNPPFANVGDAGTSIVANGNFFVNGSMISIGNVPIPTTYVSATQLMANIPANAEIISTIYDVSVANPAPGGGTSNFVQFSVGGDIFATDGPRSDALTTPDPGAAIDVIGSSNASSLATPNSLTAADANLPSTCFPTTIWSPGQTCIGGVPWLSQSPPGDWTHTKNCGPTAYAMGEAFLKGKLDAKGIRSEVLKDLYGTDQTNGRDTNITDLSQEGDRRGFRPQTAIATLDAIESQLKDGFPVIVATVSQPGSPSDDMAPYDGAAACSGTGTHHCLHFMLVVGMDPNFVYVNDPGRSDANRICCAEYKRYTRNTFETDWAQNNHGAVVFHPQLGIVSQSLHLTPGKVNQQYSATFAARLGAPPYQWMKLSGQLPAGISLAIDGTLSGTPSEQGTFSFVIRVTDANGAIADGNVALTVSPSSANILTVTSGTELPVGQVGKGYSQFLSASGGQTPYQWSMTNGSIPGVTVESNGNVSGTPTASGDFPFDVTVTDKSTPTLHTTQSMKLHILPAILPPVINSIAASSYTAKPGDTIGLICDASDPQHRDIGYAWTAIDA